MTALKIETAAEEVGFDDDRLDRISDHFRTYVDDGRLPGFAPAHLEYHRLIDHYQGLFGKDDVLVLPYEAFRDDARGFVAALAEFSEAEVDSALEYGSEPNRGHPRLVEYRTRFLNPLICRSSVNSYSSLALPNAVKPARWLRQAMANAVPAAAERRFVALSNCAMPCLQKHLTPIGHRGLSCASARPARVPDAAIREARRRSHRRHALHPPK